jgi:hypothetical protein
LWWPTQCSLFAPLQIAILFKSLHRRQTTFELSVFFLDQLQLILDSVMFFMQIGCGVYVSLAYWYIWLAKRDIDSLHFFYLVDACGLLWRHLTLWSWNSSVVEVLTYFWVKCPKIFLSIK